MAERRLVGADDRCVGSECGGDNERAAGIEGADLKGLGGVDFCVFGSACFE